MTGLATEHLLLTGPPGCGKTTIIERLIERLADLRVAGFYTQELREHGQRVGFEAVGLSGLSAILGSCSFEIAAASRAVRCRAGRTGAAGTGRTGSAGERGRCFSDRRNRQDGAVLPSVRYRSASPARRLCARRRHRCLEGAGSDRGSQRPADVRLLHVCDDNRDGLPEELERWLRNGLPSRPTASESAG